MLLALLPLGVARGNVTGELEFAWERELPAEFVGQDAVLTIYNLRLVGARSGWDGPELHRMVIRRSGEFGEVESLSTEGLPSRLVPAVIAASEGTGSIFLGGDVDGVPTLFRGEVTSGVTVEQWEELPPFPGEPEPPHSRLIALHGRGTFVYAYTERSVPGGFALGGWAAHGGVPLANFEWQPIPVPEEPRQNHAVLMSAGQVVLAGGELIDPATGEVIRPAALCHATQYEGTRFSDWVQLPIPVSRRYIDVLGASGGGGVVVAPRMPLEGEDVPSSMTVMIASAGQDLPLTEFHTAFLSIPPWHLNAMIPDFAREWVLLVGGEQRDDPPRVSAWGLPPWLDHKPLRDEDYHRFIMAEMVWDPPEISLENIMVEAEVNDRLALVVVPGSDEGRQVEVKAAMNNPTFRYMTRNMVYTYLTDEEADKARTRFGISSTPAYLVIDKDGNVAAEHSGSIPRPSELFQLTSPSRVGSPEQ